MNERECECFNSLFDFLSGIELVECSLYFRKSCIDCLESRIDHST